MKREKIIQYMELIDDNFISEANPENAKNINKRKEKRNLILRYGVLVASFFLIVSIIVVIPRLQHEDTVDPIDPIDTIDTVVPNQTDNTQYQESTGPIEDTSVHGGEETTVPNIPIVQPATGMWEIFEVLGKPTTYILLSDKQAEAVDYEANTLLYIQNEKGVWEFWSVYDDSWTMKEILEVYDITSSENILQINTTEKNTKAKEKTQLRESDLISEFYEIFKNAEVMHINSWGDAYGGSFKTDDYDIDTVLYVDIITKNGDTLSLQLYQYQDSLRQNGETIYQLAEGEGARLFEILKGISVEEYKQQIMELEALENDKVVPTLPVETAVPVIE